MYVLFLQLINKNKTLQRKYQNFSKGFLVSDKIMQKKFLTNLGLLLFLNLLVKPFWVLGIDRSVQNAVGAEDFGFYFSILNFSFIFNILLDFGITNFNNRNIAQNSQLLNKHFSGILILKTLLAIVYFVVTFLVGWMIGYNTAQFQMLAWVAFNQFLLSFILYLRSNISGLLLFKTDSIISVLDRLLMILFCSILLWGNVIDGEFKIQWFVYAQTAAYILTALIAFSIVMVKASFKRLNWNRPFILMILKKSLPFALMFLLMMTSYKIDPVFIERILPENLGKIQTGIYAQGYRLFDAVNMIAFLFGVLLLPIFSRLIKHKQSIEIIVRLAFSILITISFIVAISSYFYKNEIITILYPQIKNEILADYINRIETSASIFSILMFGFIAIASTYVFGTLLTANGNLKELNLIAGGGIIISVTLNVLLIPHLLSVGSAIANLITQFAMVFVQVIIAFRVFKFSMNKKFIFSLLTFLGSILIISYTFQFIHSNWVINYLLTLTVSFLISIAFRLINIKEVILIFKSEG